MDHLALSSSMIKNSPFVTQIGRRQRDCVRVPAAVISCRGGTGLGSKREKGRTDFYRLLSISSSKDVGCDEIKRAYRSMALRYHPDVCHDPEMKEEVTKMFVQLNEAYRTLYDPVLRSEYDFQLGLSGLDVMRFRLHLGQLRMTDLISRGSLNGQCGKIQLPCAVKRHQS